MIGGAGRRERAAAVGVLGKLPGDAVGVASRKKAGVIGGVGIECFSEGTELADEDLVVLAGRDGCAAAHARADDRRDDAEDDKDHGEFQQGEDPPAEEFARERHFGGIGWRAG